MPVRRFISMVFILAASLQLVASAGSTEPGVGEIRKFEGHTEQVTGVAFAPDGRTALFSGQDRLVRLCGFPQAPVVDRSPAALLGRAAEARKLVDFNADGDRQQELDLEFAMALREAAPTLKLITVGTDSEPSPFAKVMLNGRRLGFDAIRFKAPAKGPRLDMKWEFIMPASSNERGRAMKAWYILPLKGDMRGFSKYEYGGSGDIEGVDLPDKFHIVQGLEGGEIRPGVEYLIWFTFQEWAEEVPTYVKIDLVPPSQEVQARFDATEKALVSTFEFPNEVFGLGESPDGRRVLVAAGTSIYAGDIKANQIKKLWDEPTGVVRAAAFSSDGKLAAIGCNDGRISLVDVAAGKELRRCEGHSAAIRCLTFLPGGKKLASGSEDRTARVWDVATGMEVHKLEGHDDQVLCLAASPDGRRIATGPSISDKVARVWDVNSGKLLARLEGNAEAVYAIVFSPDGKSIVTGGEDTTLRRYGTDGRPIRRFEPDLGAKIRAVAILPDGRVVAGGDGATVSFWSGASGEQIGDYEVPPGGTQFIQVARKTRIITAHGDHSVRVWAPLPLR